MLEFPVRRLVMAISTLLSCRIAAVVLSGACVLPAVAVEPEAGQGKTRVEREHSDCLRETGSRIVSAHNQRLQRKARRNAASRSADTAEARCVSAHGRVYGRDDLDRTGAVDVADALRQLDPAIR